MSTEGMDRRLHRYFDGDLPDEERQALAREIEGDEVLRGKLLALGDVQTLVRGAAAEQPLAEADSASMWAAIEKGLGASASVADPAAASDPKPARPALRLVSTPLATAEAESPTTARSKETEAANAAPAPRTPVEDPATRRRRGLGVAIGLLALAAAAALAFLRPGDPTPDAPVATTEDTTPPEEALDPPDSMRTEVLAVDFGTNVGTIFAVEGTEGQRYAVVWLDDAVKIDEGAASPDEMAPN